MTNDSLDKSDDSDAAADSSSSEVVPTPVSHETGRLPESEPAHPMEKSPIAESKNKPSPYVFMSAGIEFTAVIGALAGIGWWLDGQWSTAPYLMLVGLAMGLIGGTYKLWRLGRTFFR